MMAVSVFALMNMAINNIIIIVRSIAMTMAVLMPAMTPPLIISEVLELLVERCVVLVETSWVVSDGSAVVI